MSDFDDHKWVLERLADAQEADKDMRAQCREAHGFVSKRSGQWEQKWWDISDGRPRYTFDQVSPIIDQIAGPIERSDFSIDVAPAGGDASDDIADLYAGLIRNIENISRAKHVYNRAARSCIVGGLDGWRIRTKYAEGDSFDQDLVIERIANFVDRVWFGPHEEPDASDAPYSWVLTGMPEQTFKEKFPNKKAADVSSDRDHNLFYHREDLVVVGEFLYLEPEERELVLVNTGKVYNAEEFAPIERELAGLGVTVVKRRTRKAMKVKSRKFSASEWLEDARETVFENWIPVVPVYGNFEMIEDKPVWFGAVEKMMDPARVYNYAQSRQIEEGALAPRRKTLLTPEQIVGYEEQWAEANTSAKPYQIYNHEDGHTPPFETGGAQINPGLKSITDDMRMVLGGVSGQFAAAMGDNPNAQSGVAIDKLQDRSDTGGNKFQSAVEHAATHTARILVDTIPRVYEQGRQVRILDEDGSRDFVTLGEDYIDNDTGQMVTLHDLSSGTYDVTCTIAPNYKNRQSETVDKLTALGQVDPSIIESAKDILTKNVNAPGMKDVAARMRQQLFQAGLIPIDQMTDEERRQAEAAAQQPPQPDPNMVMAQAEVEKAKADQMEVQRKTMEQQQRHQLEMAKIEQGNYELRLREAELRIKAEEAGVKLGAESANTRKSNAEAEAQELQNAAVRTGITRLLTAANSQQPMDVADDATA